MSSRTSVKMAAMRLRLSARKRFTLMANNARINAILDQILAGLVGKQLEQELLHGASRLHHG